MLSGFPQLSQRYQGTKKCYEALFGDKSKNYIKIYFWSAPSLEQGLAPKFFFWVSNFQKFGVSVILVQEQQYRLFCVPYIPKCQNQRNLRFWSIFFAESWRKLLRHNSCLIFEFRVAFLKNYWNKTSYFPLKWLCKPFNCNYLLILHRFKVARWESNLVNVLNFDNSLYYLQRWA